MSSNLRFFLRSVFAGVALGIIVSPFYIHKSGTVPIAAAVWGIVAGFGSLLALLVKYLIQKLRTNGPEKR